MKSSKKQIFSIRKSHFGAASVLLGTFLVLGGQSVLAEETDGVSTLASEPQPVSVLTVDEDSKELTDAKNNVENANAAVKQQEPVVTSAANAVTKVEQEKAPVKTQLEQEKAALANLANVSTQKAEDDLKAANTKKSDAETALNNAKASDAANQTKIATLDSEVKTANTDVENKQKAADALKAATENSFVLDAKVTVTKDFVNALLKRAELMGKDFNNPKYDETNPEHKANHELLTRLGAELLKSNTYTNADTTEVDLWNLTDKQRKEINFFATDIINQARRQFGNTDLIITEGMHKFAQSIADNSRKDFLINEDKKVLYGYQNAVINKAAEENGISTSLYKKEEDPKKANLSDAEILSTRQNQQDIILYNSANDRSKTYLDFAPKDGTGVNMYIAEDMYLKYRNSAAKENTEVKPIITMGKLKELIYSELTRTLFTDGDWDTDKDSQGRKWEIALSTVGEYYRQNAKYTSTTVTARLIDYKPWEAASQAWGYQKDLRLYINNHYVADFDAPDIYLGEEKIEANRVGEDHNRIVDKTKFNYAPLINDPDAAKKYDAAKKLLEDAIKLRDAKQIELDKLKAVPSEVAQKQADLDKAIEEVKKAEKALEDAKKSAANTEAEKKAKEQKIADLQKQYDELCAKLKAAQKTFTDETDKLNKLKQEANDADKKYQDLLAKQNQTQPKPPKGRDTGNNNGGDNGQVTPPTTGKGGNGGSNKGGGTSFTLPPLTINPGTTNPVEPNPTDKETPQVSGQEQPVGKTTSSAPVATTYSRVAKNAERTLPNTGEKDSVLAIAGATVLGTFGLAATRKRKVSK